MEQRGRGEDKEVEGDHLRVRESAQRTTKSNIVVVVSYTVCLFFPPVCSKFNLTYNIDNSIYTYIYIYIPFS